MQYQHPLTGDNVVTSLEPRSCVVREEEVVLHAEVSAHSGEDVEEAFHLLVDATYEKFHRGNVLFGKLDRDLLQDRPEELPSGSSENAGCGCVLS